MDSEAVERRRASRTVLKQMVRIRPFDPQFPPEYCTTFNVSESGLYFATSAHHYILGMNVHVTSDAQPSSPLQRSLTGSIVRIDELEGGQFGIAVHVFSGR